MKAILCTRPGGPDDLVLADIAAPTAGTVAPRLDADGRRRQRSRYTPRMDGPAHTDPSSTPGPGTLRPPADLARTLGELRASGWKSVPVAEEMRRNTCLLYTSRCV